MSRPNNVHLTTTRPLHAVLDPSKPKPVAYLLRGKLAEPVYGLHCWECGNPVSLDEAAEFGWSGGYAYCLGDSPRTCCPKMALIDPLPRVTKASRPRASERDSEWETKNSRSRKQGKRTKGGRKAQERDYA